MILFVKLFGILIILTGIVTLLDKKFLGRLIAFCKEGTRLYWTVALKVLFGVILLLAADKCKLTGVIMILGVIYVGGSAIGLLFGIERLKRYCEWWEKRKPIVHRLWALGAIAIGVLIIYSA